MTIVRPPTSVRPPTTIASSVVVAVLALLLGVLLHPVLPATAASAAAAEAPAASVRASGPTVLNGGAEQGVRGFVALPRHRTWLSTTPAARSGGKALRVRSARPLTVRVRATSLRAARVPSGLGVSARAWVRTARTRQPLTLVVREMVGRRVVQRRATNVVLRPGTWRRLKVSLRTRRAGSAVAIVVRASRTGRPLNLLVDDVSLNQRRAPLPPAPPAPPTQPTTPTPPTSPTTPPAGGGALTNGCVHDARGLPSCGAYLGATYGSNSDPAVLEDQVNRRLGVRRTFWRSDQVTSAVRTATDDVARGRLPWISFKLPYSWEEMTAGRGDGWARDLAERLSRIDGPVWVAFHHEPEGDGNIQAWRTMQERLAPLVRRAAPNVAFTVVVTGWNQFFGEAKYSLANIWPRGVKIDVAGFDLYNEYGVTKNGRKITSWPDFDRDYYAKIEAWARTQDVAWGVAETAYTDEGHTRDPQWIANTYADLVDRGGVAMAYFDTVLNAYGSWQLATPAKRASLAAPLRGSAALR